MTGTKRGFVAALAVLGLTAATVGVTQTGSQAATTTVAAGSVTPQQDPFYVAPANIASFAPGAVVATRPVAKATSPSQNAWQISYRSNDSHGNAELAVTTLAVPTAPWKGAGARPVVSEQLAEDSDGLQCAPSYATATSGLNIEASPFLLLKNWAVAVPDYEGPKSAWMAGPQAGHAVLDGIRAVRNAMLGGITTANPWGMDGYSGGAQGTGWAAQLQPTYAPELKLVGASIGGLPADPAAVARSMDGGIFSGFEFAAAEGINLDFPESGIDGILNTQGATDLANIRGKCLDSLLSGYALRTLAKDSIVPDPLTFPSVAAVLAADTLGATAPKTPIYDYHADTDEIVPVHQDTIAMRNWCAKGATVHIVRDLIGEHTEEAVVRYTSMLGFLSDRFAGAKPANNC